MCIYSQTFVNNPEMVILYINLFLVIELISLEYNPIKVLLGQVFLELEQYFEILFWCP